MLQNLSSAAGVIGALRVNSLQAYFARFLAHLSKGSWADPEGETGSRPH